jgi:hypothetical protein
MAGQTLRIAVVTCIHHALSILLDPPSTQGRRDLDVGR